MSRLVRHRYQGSGKPSFGWIIDERFHKLYPRFSKYPLMLHRGNDGIHNKKVGLGHQRKQ
jgi:hypothetical protein